MKQVESLEDKGAAPDATPKVAPKGPPAASPKPRSAADSSLYSTVGKEGAASGANGLGAEGGNPAVIGMQGLSYVQRGLQMLNLAFPDNPGLVAILADLTGRLQTLIPQLAMQSVNGGAGGGMLGSQMQQGPPQAGIPPAPAGAGGGMPAAGPMQGPPGPPLS